MAASSTSAGDRRALTLWTIPWITAADGSSYTETFGPVIGVPLRFITDPTTPAPSDNYDITLTDPWGFDILAGRGADRDTATTESFTPLAAGSDGTNAAPMPVAVFGNLTLTISNTGPSRAGTAYLIVG